MDWRAKVVGDFQRQQIRVHLADVWDDRAAATELTDVRGSITGPEGMALPEDVAEPLRDALNEYLGKPADDFRAKYEEARDALEVERARVDAFLARPAGLARMNEWTATIWSSGPKSWHARYYNGIATINDGPGCPWVDHARTQEKIEKKARSMLASLNPSLDQTTQRKAPNERVRIDMAPSASDQARRPVSTVR